MYIKETSEKRSNMLTEFGDVNNEINKKINAEYQLLNDYVEEKREVLLKTFKLYLLFLKKRQNKSILRQKIEKK